jgi:hypothetical protein
VADDDCCRVGEQGGLARRRPFSFPTQHKVDHPWTAFRQGGWLVFEKLFVKTSDLVFHTIAPYSVERERFLAHCCEEGFSKAALRRIAWIVRGTCAQSFCGQRPGTWRTHFSGRTDFPGTRARRQRQNPPLQESSELSPRTFCTFRSEFSSFRRQGAARGQRPYSRTRFCPSTRATTRSQALLSFAARRTGP